MLRRHWLQAVFTQVAADLNHIIRAQEVQRAVVRHRHHDTLGGGAVDRLQNIQRHARVAAGIRLLDKLL